MARRSKGPRLPRVTILASNSAELKRYSDRCEQLSASVLALVDLVARLQVQVDRLERRSAAATKANQTRRGSGGGPVAEQLGAELPGGVVDGHPYPAATLLPPQEGR